MKVANMQPYFFPYIGYFSLIKYVDIFVFFDTPQYIKRGWINRNRILKYGDAPGKDTFGYIIVPIQKAQTETSIRDIKISGDSWKRKIYAQLEYYRKKAPYYQETMNFLHQVLDSEQGDSLSDLNIRSTRAVCEYLGIQRKMPVFSQMNLGIETVNAPDEWSLHITKALGGDVYVNPPGGTSFFNAQKYIQSGIELRFLKSKLPPYIQRIGHFEPGLSIIDVMMFNDRDTILQMLDEYEILTKVDEGLRDDFYTKS